MQNKVYYICMIKIWHVLVVQKSVFLSSTDTILRFKINCFNSIIPVCLVQWTMVKVLCFDFLCSNIYGQVYFIALLVLVCLKDISCDHRRSQDFWLGKEEGQTTNHMQWRHHNFSKEELSVGQRYRKMNIRSPCLVWHLTRILLPKVKKRKPLTWETCWTK